MQIGDIFVVYMILYAKNCHYRRINHCDNYFILGHVLRTPLELAIYQHKKGKVLKKETVIHFPGLLPGRRFTTPFLTADPFSGKFPMKKGDAYRFRRSGPYTISPGKWVLISPF
jgi:hypothetical protein